MGIDMTSLKTIKIGFIMPQPPLRPLSAWSSNHCEMSTKLRHVVVGLKKRLCSSVIMDFVGDLSLMSCLMVQYYLQKQAGD